MPNNRRKPSAKKKLVWRYLPLAILGFLCLIACVKQSRPSAEAGSTSSLMGFNQVAHRLDRLTSPTGPLGLIPEPLSIAPGSWTLPGMAWQFENRTVSTLELNSTWSTVSIDNKDIGSDRPEHLAVLDLIPESRSQVTPKGDYHLRQLDHGSVRLSVQTYKPIGHSTRVVVVHVAHQIDVERWQWITLRPNQDDAEAIDHLLPLTEKGRAVGQRRGGRGEIQCEIIEWNGPIDSLLNHWRNSPGLAVQENALSPDNTLRTWTCLRANRFVHVQTTSTETTRPLTVVLTSL
jgi:hypothetical protein